MNHPVSIIVPVYNEEEILQAAIDSNLQTITQFTDDYELIIVNDGSKDRSAQIIDQVFGNHPKIVVQHQSPNGGFGSAVRKGISLATKQYVICVPVDSPLDNEVFGAFYHNLGKADVLVAYRRKRLGYSFRMKVNSWVFHQLVTHMFGMRLKDYNWIHLYDRRIFTEGGIVIQYNGLFMLAEVLIKAKRLGYSFYEFPVDQRQRLTGIATASKFSAVAKTLRDIVGFYLAGH